MKHYFSLTLQGFCIYVGCTSGLLHELAFIVCSTVAFALVQLPENNHCYLHREDIVC